eukprot:gnl/MRDRNA2_/MRDRNA2_67711_c0_seq1.p1 gnl/MRDRNA2_/MRDRNA2_67711_c0~~gnl/MRDRNA2_/MRDRNA2_67711_c0_seq1.p1  ORF type:complete len:446 (+),score=48.95 gnl/MRDRNA2_/MRDRNA2_67711_c0_seq1:134-1339(+)
MADLSLTDACAFGSLISATDPVTTLAIFEHLNVDPHLYNVVFGESVLNDAVSIVLFRTFVDFGKKPTEGLTLHDIAVASGKCLAIFIGSAILGVALAFASSLLFKVAQRHTAKMHKGGHGEELELALFLIGCYTPFLVAETVGMSGIVAILFTGIVVKRYAHANLSDVPREHSASIIALLAYAAESFVFIELGTCAWRPFHASWQLVFFICVVIMIARAAHVYPIGVLLNACPCKNASGESRFKMSHIHVVFFSGLRGAIAYALSMQFPEKYREEVCSLTMAVVLSTIWFMGGATSSILNCQGITVSAGKVGELEAECDQVVRGRRLSVLEEKYLQPMFLRPDTTPGRRRSFSDGSPESQGSSSALASNRDSIEMSRLQGSGAGEPLAAQWDPDAPVDGPL